MLKRAQSVGKSYNSNSLCVFLYLIAKKKLGQIMKVNCKNICKIDLQLERGDAGISKYAPFIHCI